MRNNKRVDKRVDKRVKKGSIIKRAAAIGLGVVLTGSLMACGSKQASTAVDESKKIKVGVCAGPYGDMFTEAIKPSLEAKGYSVEVVEFSDYVQPNISLADKEIDVNVFQHTTYLKNFSTEHNLDLTYLTEIPTAGMGIFGGSKITSLENLPNGAKVAIPNDATNLSRAIRVLQQAGLVTIDSSVDPSAATQYTLSANPKNLEFVEVEAPQLPRSLDSVDIAVINGNYALSAGLNLASALFNENILEGYINCIAVRTADKDAQFAKDILEIVHSDAFRSVIEDKSKQYYTFQRPSDY